MNYSKKIAVSLLLLCLLTLEISAQCPMCRMAAESNLDHGGSAGLGLNAGILYMLMMPYLFVATLGFIWYRNRRKEGEELILDEDI